MFFLYLAQIDNEDPSLFPPCGLGLDTLSLFDLGGALEEPWPKNLYTSLEQPCPSNLECEKSPSLAIAFFVSLDLSLSFPFSIGWTCTIKREMYISLISGNTLLFDYHIGHSRNKLTHPFPKIDNHNKSIPIKLCELKSIFLQKFHVFKRRMINSSTFASLIWRVKNL